MIRRSSKSRNLMALLEFYGRECPHCVHMDPLVKKLENEYHVKLEKYEVWHNTENAQKMSQYDKSFCGGVPFFFNTETEDYICGFTDYEALKNWARINKK